MEKNTRAKARDMKVADDEKRGEISFSPQDGRRRESCFSQLLSDGLWRGCSIRGVDRNLGDLMSYT